MTDKRRVAAAIVLDESGSMDKIRSATISGVNEWLGDQRRETSTDMDALIVHFATHVRRTTGPLPVAQIPDLTYETYTPNGNTGLYDAVMAAVRQLETIDADAYMVMIVTDGEENASREFKLDDVRPKITALEATGRWTFVYLGANVDAWTVAGAMGMRAGNVANYAATPTSAGMVFSSSSNSARRFRSDVSYSAASLVEDENTRLVEHGLAPMSTTEASAFLRSARIVTNSNYAAEAQQAAPDLNPTTTPQAPNLPPKSK